VPRRRLARCVRVVRTFLLPPTGVEPGITTARYHDLRHSYAVSALQAGDDVKTAQENMGHHTAAFTLGTYGHVTEQMKKESAARMDKFIGNILKG